MLIAINRYDDRPALQSLSWTFYAVITALLDPASKLQMPRSGAVCLLARHIPSQAAKVCLRQIVLMLRGGSGDLIDRL